MLNCSKAARHSARSFVRIFFWRKSECVMCISGVCFFILFVLICQSYIQLILGGIGFGNNTHTHTLVQWNTTRKHHFYVQRHTIYSFDMERKAKSLNVWWKKLRVIIYHMNKFWAPFMTVFFSFAYRFVQFCFRIDIKNFLTHTMIVWLWRCRSIILSPNNKCICDLSEIQ